MLMLQLMWSLNPHDKLASLGSNAVEESEACNCYCVYHFLATLTEPLGSTYLQQKPAQSCLQKQFPI